MGEAILFPTDCKTNGRSTHMPPIESFPLSVEIIPYIISVHLGLLIFMSFIIL